MDFFRNLVFHAPNVRDLGRMHNGRLECSALFTRKQLPPTEFKPILVRIDGTAMYRELPPYLSAKSKLFLLQSGDAYVVEDPAFELRVSQTDPDSEITMTDLISQRAGRPNGIPSHIPGAIRDREAQGILGDTYYVTRCFPGNYMCSSAYGSFSAALWEDRGQLAISTLLGGLSAVVAMLILFIVHLRGRSLERQLRRAIRRGEVRMVYQPIIDLTSAEIVEAEALARWNDRDDLPVSPEIFVKLAEERGFMSQLTELVVHRTLQDFKTILQSRPEFRINVNIAACDLEGEDFMPMLERELTLSQVPARQLAIELTEGSTAAKKLAVEMIRRLRQRGHSVQIDDFGTGYSSLGYLKDLAVDAIKIDQGFTQAIGTEAAIGAILPQILAMAEALNLLVIVEGIETREQAAYFAAAHCRILGQGWLYGRPVPAEEFHRRLVSLEQHQWKSSQTPSIST
jgi:sensor c-di-GMP phosphodiesterase-like protein